MSTATLTPLSPRACAHMALSLLDHLAFHDPVRSETLNNSLWIVTTAGSTPSPTLFRTFDTVDDLLGLTRRGVRAIALVTQSRINGVDGWTCLVQSTCGCLAVAIMRGGETTIIPSSSAEGYLVDLVRRIVGLSTPPEATPPIEAITACWLTRVLDEAADPLTAHLLNDWPSVIAHHPLFDRFANGLTDDDLEYDDRLTWESLRRDVANGFADCAGLLPHEAAWMDTGMFARWTLGSHRDVDELLDDCRVFLNSELFDRVLCAVTSEPH